MDSSIGFDRADYGGQPVEMVCRNCQSPLTVEYYEINGQTICEACRDRIGSALSGAGGSFGKAALYGLGAAAAGSAIYYAVLAMGAQIGLIAVLVGWMVGKAVRLGAGGIGGRRFQFLALTLTYLSITSSFLPPVMADLSKPHSASGAFSRAIMLGLLALVFPVIQLVSGGFSGVLSIVILGIGLWEAWKFTRGVPVAITGPYPLGARPALDAS